MSFDFDRIPQRRGTGSTKWEYYPEDVLPMWVADMDFASPEPVLRALHERVDHGFFGYETDPTWLPKDVYERVVATCRPPVYRLAEVVCERMERLYRWRITPEDILFLPSLVAGINLSCRAVGQPGESVLMLTPTYPPFLSAPKNHQLALDTFELTLLQGERTIDYAIDFDAFDAAFHGGTRMFLLSNPHNPVGKDHDAATLARLAESCLRHDVVICSDEIHCELLLGETRHVPLAAIAPEIAARTITLMSPSKTFNLPGLGCGLAIVTDPELRARLRRAAEGIVPHPGTLGYAGALAAFSEGGEWLAALRRYLTANRDLYVSYIVERLPQLRTTVPDSTYLGWIDCREAGIAGNPQRFFLEQAKVALSDGATFGPGGAGFVRLNFGCPRALLLEGLERMRVALER
ncbi:MAG TPA: PatB family C-S lyase [Roseiflexaceae bacterium]|nr:PatB family C-S lyase [Roseiflexaceae bacterium]